MIRNIQGKYIHLFYDFSFKRLFGTQNNRDILMAFLNDVFHGSKIITDVVICNNERLGRAQWNRKSFFDIYCSTADGERIVIELQNEKTEWFMHRSLFYAAMDVLDQGMKGEWDFYLAPVHVVCILNFCFEHTGEKEDFNEVGLLSKQSHQVLNDRLAFTYLEVPKFKKTKAELESGLDMWLYLFANMHTLQEMPEVYKNNKIFEKVFELAAIENLNPEEMKTFTAKQMEQWDHFSKMQYAKKEGVMEGRKEALLETARKLKVEGFSDELISKTTGLILAEIKTV